MEHGAQGAALSAPCQEVVWEGNDVDLARLPIQHCWPGDVAPLITWGLVITQGPHKPRQNLGIYRQQVLVRNQVIMRWLAHRGGALDFRDHGTANPGQPYPVAVAMGADPATILGAVTPVPDSLSEYQFAGLLRGARTEVCVKALGSDAAACRPAPRSCSKATSTPTPPTPAAEPARAGRPVRRPHRLLQRARRIPGVHGRAHHDAQGRRSTTPPTPANHPTNRPCWAWRMNELFIPLLQRQFPEITDFHLPPEGCSYRMARGADPQGLPRPRAARDDGRVEPPAPVHVHQVHRGGGRRRGRARLERSDLGA